MLQERDALIAKQFKKRVRSITKIERLVVYGSRARGDAGKDSDLDIFIEVPNLTPELRRKILEIAWEVSFEYEVVISTFLTYTDFLMNSPLAGSPIIKAIETEGVAV